MDTLLPLITKVTTNIKFIYLKYQKLITKHFFLTWVFRNLGWVFKDFGVPV
jgi:hypothetical protein